MRARTLIVPLVALCLSGGVLTACNGHGDDKAGSSSPSTATAGSSSTSPGTSRGASPSAGASPTDRINNDHGAPGQPDAQGRQTVVFDRVPGNTTGACEVVGARRDVKSGGFVAGAFDDARKSFGKKRPGSKRNEVRLYFVPAHAKKMPGLKVTATSGGQRVSVSQKVVSDAEQWKFYDTQIVLPKGGTWTFRASAGPDRGNASPPASDARPRRT